MKNKLSKVLFTLLTIVVLLMATDCATNPPISSAPVTYKGVNCAGGELDYGSSNTTNPVSGTDYQFCTHQDIDYIQSKGANFVRLTFSIEAMYQTLNSPLTPNVPTSGWTSGLTTYSATFQDIVNYITTTKGMYVLVEPHGGSSGNFWHYKGALIGSSGFPNSSFATFWGEMGTLFKGNSKVFFGLGNEPNGFSTAVLTSAEQAAITSIRASGFTNTIFVPGNCWTSAVSYTSSSCDVGNPQIASSTAFLTLQDPSNNLIASIHLYMDSQEGGLDTSIQSATIGVNELTSVVNWANANKVNLHVSEFAASASNSLAVSATTNVYNYVNANPQVKGISWWCMGPWFSSYMFTVEPTYSNPIKDSAQMALLSPYLLSGTATTPVDSGTSPPVDSGIVKDSGSNQLVDSGSVANKDAGTQSDSGTVSQKDAGTPVVDSGSTSTASQLVVSSQVITNSPTEYCKQFTFTNNTSSAITWHSFELNMRGGTVLNQANGTMNVWNVAFSSATGDPVVTPTQYPVIGVGSGNNSLTWGFCASYATSGNKWTATEVNGSLK